MFLLVLFTSACFLRLFLCGLSQLDVVGAHFSFIILPPWSSKFWFSTLFPTTHTHTLSQLCGVVTIAASLSSASPLPSVPKICQHPLQLIEAFALKDLGKVVWGGRASLMKSDLIKRYSCQCERRAKTRRDKGEEAGESIGGLFST